MEQPIRQNNAPSTQPMPGQMLHGGHELFDIHELLSNTISLLDQYMMLRQLAKDPELVDMINRQYQYISDCYNITVEALKTGRKPSHPTQVYMMKQDHTAVYGMQPSQQKAQTAQSVTEINDQKISTQMLQLIKSSALLHTMAASETVNPVLRRMLADSVANYLEMAYEIFLYQNKHGYYQVPQFDRQTTEALVNRFAPINTAIPQNQSMGTNQTH
jgi:spore coat protein CotF